MMVATRRSQKPAGRTATSVATDVGNGEVGRGGGLVHEQSALGVLEYWIVKALKGC